MPASQMFRPKNLAAVCTVNSGGTVTRYNRQLGTPHHHLGKVIKNRLACGYVCRRLSQLLMEVGRPTLDVGRPTLDVGGTDVMRGAS